MLIGNLRQVRLARCWAPDGADAGAGNPGAGASPENDGEGGTFTQAEVDAILARKEAKIASKAANKASRSAAEALAAKFGIDVDEIDDLAERHKSTADAASQAESWQRRAKKHEATLAELQAENEKLRGAEHARRKRRVLESAAGEACNDLDLLLDHLEARGRLGVTSDGEVIALDESGDPAGVTVQELVTQTLKSKPHLQRAAPGVGGGSRPADGSAGMPNKPLDLGTAEGIEAGWNALQQRFLRKG